MIWDYFENYSDNVNLILQFSHILTDSILVGQLGFNVGNPDEETSHTIIA